MPRFETSVELPSDPSEDLEAATKQYVDSQAGGASELTDLTDVDTDGVANNNFLRYSESAGEWLPVAVSPGSGAENLDDLNDVDLPSVEEGDMLYLNDSGLWVVVAGSKDEGAVPAVQGDGSVAWQTPVGGGGGAFELIDSQVLESAAASVVFSSIPGSFSDLQVRTVARTSDSSTRLMLARFNGDTGSNYGWTRNFGHTATNDSSGTTQTGDYTGDTSIAVGTLPGTETTAGEPAQSIIDINGYTGTTFRKLLRAVGSARINTQMREENFGGIWANTAAITSVTLFPSAGNFIVGSRFALYGIG